MSTTGRLAAVRKDKKKRPLRLGIIGIEGVGKSTLGNNAPKPIFIGPEGGVDELQNSHEMPGVETWQDVRDSVRELINNDHEYQTCCLDSIDWIEKLCHAHICKDTDKNIITVKGGYGSGYRESEKLHRELISDLAILREKRGMHIILMSHYHVKTVKDPEAVSDYDAFEIKCHEMVSALWREWVDVLLFVRFKTYVKVAKDDDSKTIAFGDSNRVAFTEKRPAFQAKNRYALPPEMPFNLDFWDKLMELTGRAGKRETTKSLKKEIDELSAKVKDTVTSKAIVESVGKANNNMPALTAIRNRLRTLTAA